MNMNARIQWVNGLCLVGESGSGHSVVMDGSEEFGGRNTGTRPMEMVLLGLGGCTAMDVLSILNKSHQPISDCVIEITATRAETVPKVFTVIHLHFIVTGQQLKEKLVKRAVDLSAQKYCSVSKMLENTVTMSHDYSLVDDSISPAE